MANYKKWTHEEDIVLMSHLSQEGKTEGFKRAAVELGRTYSSCRSRYYSNKLDLELNREIKVANPYKEPIMVEEHRKEPVEEKKGFWYSIIHFFKRNK